MADARLPLRRGARRLPGDDAAAREAVSGARSAGRDRRSARVRARAHGPRLASAAGSESVDPSRPVRPDTHASWRCWGSSPPGAATPRSPPPFTSRRRRSRTMSRRVFASSVRARAPRQPQSGQVRSKRWAVRPMPRRRQRPNVELQSTKGVRHERHDHCHRLCISPGRPLERGADDWANLMEPTEAPLHLAGLDQLAVGPGISLLDVGCGSGAVLRIAADRGADVTGTRRFARAGEARAPPRSGLARRSRRHPVPPVRGRELRRRHGLQLVPVRG